jgi:hypothetical protein
MSWLRLRALHPRSFLLAFPAIALMIAALVLPAAAQARVKLVRVSSSYPGDYATLTAAVSPARRCSIVIPEGGSGELDVEGRHQHDVRPLGDHGFVRLSRNSPHVLPRPLDKNRGSCLGYRTPGGR